MSHRCDGAESWALRLLNQIVEHDKRNRDALPGSAMKHIKEARRVLIKKQKESSGSSRDRIQHDRF